MLVRVNLAMKAMVPSPSTIPGRIYAGPNPAHSSGPRIGENPNELLSRSKRSKPLTNVGTETPSVDVPSEK
jgi:hypothetical protein